MSYAGLGQFISGGGLTFNLSATAKVSPDWRAAVKTISAEAANAISAIPVKERLESARAAAWAALQRQFLDVIVLLARANTETDPARRLFAEELVRAAARTKLSAGVPASAPTLQSRVQWAREAAPAVDVVRAKLAAAQAILVPGPTPAQQAAAKAAADNAAAAAADLARRTADAAARQAQSVAAEAERVRKLAAENAAWQRTQAAAADAARAKAVSDAAVADATEKARVAAAADAVAAAAAATAANPMPLHVGPMPDGKLPPTTPYSIVPGPSPEPGTWDTTPMAPAETTTVILPVPSPGPLGISWMVWGIGAAVVAGGGYLVMRKKTTTPNRRRRVRRNRRR